MKPSAFRRDPYNLRRMWRFKRRHKFECPHPELLRSSVLIRVGASKMVWCNLCGSVAFI